MSSNRSKVVEKRRLLRVFRIASATSPKGTIVPKEYSIEKGPVFRRMVERGILKETSQGWFYLDEGRMAYLKKRDGRMVILLLVSITVCAFIIFLLIYKYL